MVYALEFVLSAEREFRKLTRDIQLKLRPRIDALANDPRPAGAKKLKGARRPAAHSFR
jgi:mRNA interferase RelE/StbE